VFSVNGVSLKLSLNKTLGFKLMMILGARISKFTLMVSLLGIASFTKADVIFTENFDDQPDWHSGFEINDLKWLNPFNVRSLAVDGADAEQFKEQGHVLPNGWHSARQSPVWAESFGDVGFPENVEILAANADKARGGTGKSLVVYRQSTSNLSYQWPSDGQLDTKLSTPSNEIFVSFRIRFSDNWTPVDTVTSGMTKLFRISSVDEGGNPFSAFSDGDASSIFVWGYQASADFGVRHLYTFRADPQETNYSMNNPKLPNLPTTSGSHNYVAHIRDLDGDGVEDNVVTLPSLVTGNPLGADGGTVLHDEVWGGGIWRKMAFYVRMNSAPGELDGAVMVWMDDQLLFKNESVPWQGKDAPGGIKWNYVGFGGNSNFHEYDDAVRRTEWRAYDDIVVRTSIPEELLSDVLTKPNPPASLIVQ
jgi:hypothetical protein